MTEKKKILIIDDEEELCSMISLRFNCLGYETDCAFNGIAGLKKVKEYRPDIVLLDVVMPLMDGWEVCKQIKSDPKTKQIKVILVTATQSDGLLECKAKNMGADAVFIKPFDESEVLAVINKF